MNHRFTDAVLDQVPLACSCEKMKIKWGHFDGIAPYE
jgi:hypothetical protein